MLHSQVQQFFNLRNVLLLRGGGEGMAVGDNVKAKVLRITRKAISLTAKKTERVQQHDR